MQQLLDNRSSYAVVDKMIWVGLGSLQNNFRKKIGLDTLGSKGATIISKLKVPQLYCMSPHLAPKPTVYFLIFIQFNFHVLGLGLAH